MKNDQDNNLEFQDCVIFLQSARNQERKKKDHEQYHIRT